ncbi:hypothetical protein KY285_024820 [Solanum tuberosum]|nr:hypothetical protein KY289_025035 [Solanum tuberosum]KAH0673714.1 hypothetical protein KY284_024801 [Solanum tuberosum]KAH0677019.1 hypothetical protein KY285_024820 [Solanum tuberosum]
MKKLGQECLDDLLWYNLNTWCKKYFQNYSKCDVMDNNMAESFNAWILPARYKTIITVLEEIRVKIMKRIGDLREFLNTWITDIYPMSLKILQENIEKFMQCNLTWNGERSFEIKHHGFTHTVDIVSRSCSCRSWQLRGIPCPHGAAALHYKELEPIHSVASCYSKETYLSTYAHFIQPMNNMKMWPASNNPIVKPPKIKKLPGRPGKVRRKEANESRKTEKLSKRGCPTRNQVGPSQSTEPSSQARCTGPSQSVEPSSQTQEEAHEEQQEAEQGLVVQLNHLELLHKPPQIMKLVEEEAYEEFQTVNSRERGRGRGTSRGAGTGRGRGMPQERNTNEGLGRGRVMAQHSQTSSETTYSGRGLERGKRPVEHEDTTGGQARPFKRPRMVGVGIYQAKDGFTTLNPGLPSRRVINTGTRVTKRVVVVTGDIGYTPIHGFKWKGKRLSKPVAT